MPRKKQLKVNGSSIGGFDVQVKNVKSDHAEMFIDVVDLEIHANGDAYRYDIRSDDRAPDVHQIRDYIENSLKKARQDFLKVEIAEYKERMYLFFNVQSIGQVQYTGYRV